MPSEWLVAAGLAGFRPASAHWRCDEPHVLLPTSSIRPARSWHNDDRERICSILAAIRDNVSLPPVRVAVRVDATHMVDGHHRFFAATALGFSMLPAVVL